jgi:nicotinate-nucleotide adenylyltransferase
MEILTWQGAERLLTLCEFVAVQRPGYEMNADYIKNLREKNAKIHLLEGPLLEISSTEIRKNIATGQPVNGLMPRESETYAQRHALFHPPETPAERFQKAKEQLEQRLSPRRFKHTLGTITEAEKLANHYGADPEKARWAALLHDCAKEFSAGKKRYLCDKWGIQLDSVLTAHIDITHSLLGAESAKRDFFIDDEEILQAIRYHTIGHGKMTLLDKIIMLADYIEPYREDYHPLTEMRQLAYKNINKALLTGMKATNDEIKQRGHSVHPWSKNALRELKK